MIKCWEFEPQNRPSFQELHKNTSSYIARIAGYLEVSYNPFEGAGGNTLQGKEEEEEEEEESLPDPGIAIEVHPPSLKCCILEIEKTQNYDLHINM